MRLLMLAVFAVFWTTAAQAHGYHSGCAYGDTAYGPIWHFHPGGGGRAQPCRGGGREYYPEERRYYREDPRYYREGVQGGRDNPNRGCPRYWTRQDGVCKPYSGR
jgi:hypothetical protein